MAYEEQENETEIKADEKFVHLEFTLGTGDSLFKLGIHAGVVVDWSDPEKARKLILERVRSIVAAVPVSQILDMENKHNPVETEEAEPESVISIDENGMIYKKPGKKEEKESPS